MRILKQQISEGGLPPLEVSLVVTDDDKVESYRICDISHRPVDGTEVYPTWMPHETQDLIVAQVAKNFGLEV